MPGASEVNMMHFSFKGKLTEQVTEQGMSFLVFIKALLEDKFCEIVNTL